MSIAWTIVATAATTLAVAAIFFFLFHRFYVARRNQPENKANSSFHREEVITKSLGRNVKGVIVDENGMEVFYLKKLESGQLGKDFPKVVFNPSYEEDQDEEEKRVNVEEETCKSSRPHHHEEVQLLHLDSTDFSFADDIMSKPVVQKPILQVTPSAPYMVMQKPTMHALVLPPSSPPPPPTPLPPPPPPPPPPLPVLVKRKSLQPPNLPKTPASGRANNKKADLTTTGENSKTIGVSQMKLKPLHWDKVAADVDHSMVWDEINDGSFRVDDELIENLFGYGTANQQSSERNSNILLVPSRSNSNQPTQVFILDPRKSQNTAIVLRSLAISRKEILDSLIDGHGIGSDTLEKLTKISPTKEEETKILNFNGNPERLADAESFLYHILKAIPSAFTRFDAMLFRANYEPEIIHLKESLQTLEMGCKELRARGLFLKLLEAILKAGNKLNSGTARGNALGFNLSTLRKLSDIKSRDGKTTLLHFVVEQVARSEGRRCGTNQKNILSSTPEDQEKEYLMLGLPALEGLSAELLNVKKAAFIEYESFINMCSNINGRLAEIDQKILSQCGNGGDEGSDGFAKEMKGFLEECEEELEVVGEEQSKVMEMVKRTTEYYQTGALKDKGENPLQLFITVKDFLGMVDQVCVEINRKMQKKSVGITANTVGSSPPLSPSTLANKMFQNLNSHFMQDASSISSSDSDTDF